MATTNKNPPITIEKLLKVKRSERPDADFWECFESDFERRRLNALVERKSIFDFLWTPTVKALAYSAPVVLLLGVVTFWVRFREPVHPESHEGMGSASLLVADGQSINKQEASSLTPVAMSKDFEQQASSHFVLDAIENTSRRQVNFRKILYTPAIQFSMPSGASYVQDSMKSQNYRVTTADFKLGRNF